MFFTTETVMKKLTFALFAVMFILTSCTAPADSELLAYQGKAAQIRGILYTDTGAVCLDVTLGDASEEELISGVRNATLTFACDSGSHTAAVTDGKATLSACGLSVPCSEKSSQYYAKLASLFALDPDTLYSVEAGDDGTLSASFGTADGEAVTVTIDSATSLPRVIESENGTLRYEISEYLPSSSDG